MHKEPGYPLLLYLLILRNPCFRNYCRSNAEKVSAGCWISYDELEVLPAMLEVLYNVSDNKIQAGLMALRSYFRSFWIYLASRERIKELRRRRQRP